MVARAQLPSVPMIGWLSSQSADFVFVAGFEYAHPHTKYASCVERILHLIVGRDVWAHEEGDRGCARDKLMEQLQSFHHQIVREEVYAGEVTSGPLYVSRVCATN